MRERPRRPFYAEYAWAFDLLIDRPVRKECAAIASWLIDRGVLPGSDLLDAGCGTGRYAAELARRGYSVHGIDRSPELIAVASRSNEEPPLSLSFAVDDILKVPARRFDAILCRGVLNDLLEDRERDAVFDAFARALRPGGVLILDVRDWEASAGRKAREPLFRKRVETERGTLTFTSVTALDFDRRLLLLSERHTLLADGLERSSEYQFVMRCWTREELSSFFSRVGFADVVLYGAYDDAVPVGATDRIVAVGRRSR